MEARPFFREDQVAGHQISEKRLPPSSEIGRGQADADDVPRPGGRKTKVDEAPDPHFGPRVELEDIDPGASPRAQEDSPLAAERSLRIRSHVDQNGLPANDGRAAPSYHARLSEGSPLATFR
jgi:hypothetical protein